MGLDEDALAKLAALSDAQLAPDVPGERQPGSTGGSGGAGRQDHGGDRPESRDEDAGSAAWRALREAVAAECGLEVDAVTPRLRLAEDLDCDDLSRYAITAQTERACGARMLDADVDAAQTVGDLLAAAESTRG